jgi:LemA protein
MSMWWIPLVIVAVLAVLLISLYNSLVRQRLVVNEATADIETFLKQRYDMIPNLVNIVKGYAKHEKELFENVTSLRAKAMSAGNLEDKMEFEGELSKALSRIIAVAENYPALRANENFLQLQSHLKDLEDNIQKARRFYNGAVRDFNTRIAVFPNNLIAGMLGFNKMPFFEATEEEKENVDIKF